MQGTQVNYLGRSIAKEGFRAFIYSANGQTKLVESWEQFENYMASGIWFASKEEIVEQKVEEVDGIAESKQVYKKRGK